MDTIFICEDCAVEADESLGWSLLGDEPEFLDMSARCWDCDNRVTGNYYPAELIG